MLGVQFLMRDMSQGTEYILTDNIWAEIGSIFSNRALVKLSTVSYNSTNAKTAGVPHFRSSFD